MSATASTAVNPIALRQDEGEALWFLGVLATIKASRETTEGRVAVIEHLAPQGAGSPLHVHHNEDETFYVLEGELTFLVGDERIDIAAGDFLFAPRDIPHAYVVRSERARILSTITPAGIEQLFVSLGTPVAGAEPPTDMVMPPMPEMAHLFAAHGAEILGPPPSLSDLP